jgi:hypothetical protein
MVQAGRTATFLFKIPLFNRKKATHLERAANVKGFWGFRTVTLSLLRAFAVCQSTCPQELWWQREFQRRLAAWRAHVRGKTLARHRAFRFKSGLAH